jgi:hypothetical protein
VYIFLLKGKLSWRFFFFPSDTAVWTQGFVLARLEATPPAQYLEYFRFNFLPSSLFIYHSLSTFHLSLSMFRTSTHPRSCVIYRHICLFLLLISFPSLIAWNYHCHLTWDSVSTVIRMTRSNIYWDSIKCEAYFLYYLYCLA